MGWKENSLVLILLHSVRVWALRSSYTVGNSLPAWKFQSPGFTYRRCMYNPSPRTFAMEKRMDNIDTAPTAVLNPKEDAKQQRLKARGRFAWRSVCIHRKRSSSELIYVYIYQRAIKISAFVMSIQS